MGKDTHKINTFEELDEISSTIVLLGGMEKLFITWHRNSTTYEEYADFLVSMGIKDIRIERSAEENYIFWVTKSQIAPQSVSTSSIRTSIATLIKDGGYSGKSKYV